MTAQLPTEIELAYSYTGFQQSQGDNSFPGTQMDNDLANIQDALNSAIAFINRSFNSDGTISGATVLGLEDVTVYVDRAEASADAAAASAAETQDLADSFGDMAEKDEVAISDIANFSAAQKLLGAGSAGAVAAELAAGYGALIVGTTLYCASPFQKRQCAQYGPVNSVTGFADFLPSTNAALSITSQNVSSTVPFIVEAANGALSRIGLSTSNLVWSGLTASQRNYLYVTVNADGTLTTGSTTVAPVYQQGGTPAITNNLFTFNFGEMIGYLGNGSAAAQAWRVYVGEALCDGTTVTSSEDYAYRGHFLSTQQSIGAAASLISASHNIGVPDCRIIHRIVCTTTEGNYAVGDVVEQPSINSNSNFLFPSIYADRKTVNLRMPSVTAQFTINNKTTGAGATLTSANWKVIFEVTRPW